MITPETAKRNVAINLSRIRKLRGMTQEQLAKVSGVSQGTISTAEKGVGVLMSDKLFNLAECLSTTSDFLLREPPAEAVSA